MTLLKKQKVLVLGGSGAMGKAVGARVVANEGEALLVGRDGSRLAAAAAELGPKARTLGGDFADAGEAAKPYALAGPIGRAHV